jgi:hypothetical protein
MRFAPKYMLVHGLTGCVAFQPQYPTTFGWLNAMSLFPQGLTEWTLRLPDPLHRNP